MIDEKKLDSTMLKLGFTELHEGTRFLRTAVMIWDAQPGQWVCKELYPAVAKVWNTTPGRVERNCRYAICAAFMRADWYDIRQVFGGSISADSGRPTVGQFVSRMAVYVRAD